MMWCLIQNFIVSWEKATKNCSHYRTSLANRSLYFLNKSTTFINLLPKNCFLLTFLSLYLSALDLRFLRWFEEWGGMIVGASVEKDLGARLLLLALLEDAMSWLVSAFVEDGVGPLRRLTDVSLLASQTTFDSKRFLGLETEARTRLALITALERSSVPSNPWLSPLTFPEIWSILLPSLEPFLSIETTSIFFCVNFAPSACSIDNGDLVMPTFISWDEKFWCNASLAA